MGILGKDSYRNDEKAKMRGHWKDMCARIVNECNEWKTARKIEMITRYGYRKFSGSPENIIKERVDTNLKYRQDMGRYLCLPGKEFLELEEVIKPLGIPLDRVFGIERDDKTAQEIYQKWGINVGSGPLEDFLGEGHRLEQICECKGGNDYFSMLNIDLCDKISSDYYMNIRAMDYGMAHFLKEHFVIAINVLGRREDEDGKYAEAQALCTLVASMMSGFVNENLVKKILSSGREMRSFTTLFSLWNLMRIRSYENSSEIFCRLPVDVKKWAYYNETSPMITSMSEWNFVEAKDAFDADKLFMLRIGVPDVCMITPKVKKDKLTIKLNAEIKGVLDSYRAFKDYEKSRDLKRIDSSGNVCEEPSDGAIRSRIERWLETHGKTYWGNVNIDEVEKYLSGYFKSNLVDVGGL